MIPVLYDSSVLTDISSGGLGIGHLTDAIDCKVTCSTDGEFVLEMEYPLDGIHAEDIACNMVIASTYDMSENIQYFVIQKITNKDDTIEITANHISYLLLGYTLPPKTEINSSTKVIDFINDNFANASSDSDPLKNKWSFTCSKEVTVPINSEGATGDLYSMDDFVSVREALVSDNGLMAFGNRIKWDNFAVNYCETIGEDKSDWLHIKYGKNVQGIEREIDYSSFPTKVQFYYYNDSVETARLGNTYSLGSGLSEVANGVVLRVNLAEQIQNIIEIELRVFNALVKDATAGDGYMSSDGVHIDDSWVWTIYGGGDSQAITTTYWLDLLNLNTSHLCQEVSFDNTLCTPPDYYFEAIESHWLRDNKALYQAAEFPVTAEFYPNLGASYLDDAVFEKVNFGDIVTLDYSPLNVSGIVEVMKTEYNVLADRYESASLGKINQNLADILADIEISQNAVGSASEYYVKDTGSASLTDTTADSFNARATTTSEQFDSSLTGQGLRFARDGYVGGVFGSYDFDDSGTKQQEAFINLATKQGLKCVDLADSETERPQDGHLWFKYNNVSETHNGAFNLDRLYFNGYKGLNSVITFSNGTELYLVHGAIVGYTDEDGTLHGKKPDYNS